MREVEAAVKEIAARHGLEFTKQHAKFGPDEMTTRITMKTAGMATRCRIPEAAVPGPGRAGRPADGRDGEDVHLWGARYTVEGLNMERPKYPVICRRMDGRRFKFGILEVKNGLEREADRC